MAWGALRSNEGNKMMGFWIYEKRVKKCDTFKMKTQSETLSVMGFDTDLGNCRRAGSCIVNINRGRDILPITVAPIPSVHRPVTKLI